MTSKRERIEAAIQGEVADRAPVALWRHFPVDDQDPGRLADAVACFQECFDFDFVKVTPASSFCLKDWGVEDEWRGSTEGTREYTKRVIEMPEDWNSLLPLDPGSGHLADQLRCLTLLRKRLGDDIPIIQTIFNPLSQAKNLSGQDRLFEHLHRSPNHVERGLQTILDSTLAFIEALKAISVDGIFFAVQHASFRYFDPAGYARFGEHYDLPILEAAESWWLNVLHLHGEAIMFDVASRYPVQVVNWHDRETSPSLDEGVRRFNGAVCGGTCRDTLALGTAQEVRKEARAALETVGSRGLILSTGCVVPIIAADGNIQTVRDAVDFA
jgi:uroporphyrinogen decarboxylase